MTACSDTQLYPTLRSSAASINAVTQCCVCSDNIYTVHDGQADRLLLACRHPTCIECATSIRRLRPAIAGHVTCRLCNRDVGVRKDCSPTHGQQQRLKLPSPTSTAICIDNKYGDGVYSELDDVTDDNKQPKHDGRKFGDIEDNKIGHCHDDGKNHRNNNIISALTTGLFCNKSRVSVRRYRLVSLLILFVLFCSLSVAALAMSFVQRTTLERMMMMTDGKQATPSHNWPLQQLAVVAPLVTPDSRINDLWARIGRIEDSQKKIEERLDEERKDSKSSIKRVERLESKVEDHELELGRMEKDLSKVMKMAEQVYNAVFRSSAAKQGFSCGTVAAGLALAWLGRWCSQPWQCLRL